MSTIDRVMRAYASKHALTPSQAAFVRTELSDFIGEPASRRRRDPTMFNEARKGVAPRTSKAAAECRSGASQKVEAGAR